MARLGIVSAATILQAATANSAATYTPNRLLAENIFTSFDDVVVNQPDDNSLPATGGVMIDPQSQKPLRRDFDGEFTWLATITPRKLDPNQALPTVSNNYTLSIVVFDRRLVPRPLNSNTISLVGEATVLVDAATMGSGIGGGDMNLRSDNSDLLDNLVRPNQWIMLTRREGRWNSPTNGSPVRHQPVSGRRSNGIECSARLHRAGRGAVDRGRKIPAVDHVGRPRLATRRRRRPANLRLPVRRRRGGHSTHDSFGGAIDLESVRKLVGGKR